MITRKKALNFINGKVENKNIVKHMLAAEVLMGGVWEFLKEKGESDLGGTKEEWMMAGLLHDGDYVEGVPESEQGIKVVEWLKEEGEEVPKNVAQAVAAHNFSNTGVGPQSKMDWALYCGDSLTGLVVASTLVLASRKLSDLTVENVLKRFKEVRFAAGTRREDIAKCEGELGISLPEFVRIGVEAMRGIDKELGL